IGCSKSTALSRQNCGFNVSYPRMEYRLFEPRSTDRSRRALSASNPRMEYRMFEPECDGTVTVQDPASNPRMEYRMFEQGGIATSFTASMLQIQGWNIGCSNSIHHAWPRGPGSFKSKDGISDVRTSRASMPLSVHTSF